jgi:hypothetical protein
MMLDMDYHQKVVQARVSVGILGEKSSHDWWASEFFSPTSDAYLNPVLPNTKSLAQYHGVVEAARRIHDDSIGIGQRVFHLFRLPAALEQQLHETVLLRESDELAVASNVTPEQALESLEEIAGGKTESAIGPIALGGVEDFTSEQWLIQVSQYYLNAFRANTQCFPYIKANT